MATTDPVVSTAALPATLCHVVIGADGVVLGADGETASWLGSPLIARDDVSDDVRRVASALIARLHDPARTLNVVSAVVPGPPAIELTAVAAVPVRRTSVDLRTLLVDALEPLRQQAAAGDISLTIEADTKLPRGVVIDCDKVAWAVSMLVGNALRYVRHGTQRRPGGEIVVSASRTDAPVGCVVTVSDDGPGIPREILGTLLDRKGPRRALALMLVNEIVSAHGGRFSVESSTDAWRHGTKFTIWLPTA